MLRYCVIVFASLLVSGCQIESRATITVAQIRAAGATGVTSPVPIDIAVQFPTEYFCGNYKDKTLEVLRSQFGAATFVECKRVQKKNFGYYRITTQLVKTPADGTFKEQILGGKIAGFGVYDNPRKGGGYVVGGLIRNWKFQDIKKALEKIYKLPTQQVNFEALLRNETSQPVEIEVDRMTVNRELVSGKSKFMLQAGRSIVLGFSADKISRIRRNGGELMFSITKL